MNFLPKFFTSKAILTYIFVLLICQAIFPNKLPFLWIAFGLFEVFTFFHFSNYLSVKWLKLPENILKKRIFTTALIIRIIYVVAIYFFYQELTGKPFEFQAADSITYHEQAQWAVGLIKNNNFNHVFYFFKTGYSDIGYLLFMAGTYLLFGSGLLIPRIINAILGAWMCVLIYKLANRNFGEATARIAAILAILLPNFIYYTGLHLKETLMVFLLVAFIEGADSLLRKRNFNIGNVPQVLLLGGSLFLFRTVLGVAAIFTLFSAVVFSNNRFINSYRRFIIGSLIIFAALFFFSGRIKNEINFYFQTSDTNQEMQMLQYSYGGQKLAKYGKTSVFLPLILFAPFPTLVDTKQENSMMINGAVFTRNIYAFFVILGLFVLFRLKLIRNHILIIFITSSYLIILSLSGFAFSERFHMPVLPFLLILAAFGITQMNDRYKNYYIPYIILVGAIIIGWNWFKLVGRGMI